MRLANLRASFGSNLSLASRCRPPTHARRQQMQDLAQTALPIGIELAGSCDGCLDQVGEIATRRGIRRQQPPQRLNCGAFVHGQDRPLLAHSSFELGRRDFRVCQKQLVQGIDDAGPCRCRPTPVLQHRAGYPRQSVPANDISPPRLPRDDIRALGCNSIEDEREFAPAARISELNNALYQTFLQPWIKMMSGPQNPPARLGLRNSLAFSRCATSSCRLQFCHAVGGMD
jgi:hypothetical protein